MAKVNSQIGKTRSLILPINGDFWEELEGWRIPDSLGLKKKEVLAHRTLRKSQWLRGYEVARLRKMLPLSTGNISNVML